MLEPSPTAVILRTSVLPTSEAALADSWYLKPTVALLAFSMLRLEVSAVTVPCPADARKLKFAVFPWL